MQLWEHLEELRWTIFKIIIVLAVTTGCSFYFLDEIMKLLMQPIQEVSAANPDFVIKTILTSPFDGVIIKMKTAFLGGIVLGYPFLLYYIWSFISSGLKKHENKAFFWICAFGTIFFLFGVICGYYLISPVLNILVNMSMESAENFWTVKEFISFEFYWLIVAGIIFELPLAMVILTRLGVIDVKILRKIRPFFYIGAFVVAAIITPPDPFTMMVVGVPLIFLYEIGIFFASFHKPAAKGKVKG